jgi:hypothetical protein
MLESSEDYQQIHQEQPKTTNQKAEYDWLFEDEMGELSKYRIQK